MDWMNFRMLETIFRVNIEQLKLLIVFVGNILRIEQIGNRVKLRIRRTRFDFVTLTPTY